MDKVSQHKRLSTSSSEERVLSRYICANQSMEVFKKDLRVRNCHRKQPDRSSIVQKVTAKRHGTFTKISVPTIPCVKLSLCIGKVRCHVRAVSMARMIQKRHIFALEIWAEKHAFLNGIKRRRLYFQMRRASASACLMVKLFFEQKSAFHGKFLNFSTQDWWNWGVLAAICGPERQVGDCRWQLGL